VRNLTISQGSFNRQDTSEVTLRLRTSSTSNSGREWTSRSNGLPPELTHVVFSIAADGKVRMYINGALRTSGTYAGTLATWNTTYRLLLGNELQGGRGWQGTYYLVAFYNRALSAAEVAQNYAVGP
jgi:hypothetical protein